MNLNRILKALGIERKPEKDDVGGSYEAGWNGCLEFAIREPHPMKRGEGGVEYVRGWNAARSTLLNAPSAAGERNDGN